LEDASRQLVATKRSLADIALAAGFADQAHFSRVFKERTGMTPAKFRAAFAIS
jgi:AraC family transcriptional regulator